MSTSFLIKFLSLVGGVASAGSLPATDKPCCAIIEQHASDGIVTFTGFFQNNLEEIAVGTYSLDAIREGQSGRSVSRQRGRFESEGRQKTELSKFSVNISEEDSYTIVLKIYVRDVFLCADSVKVGENNHVLQD